MEKYFVNNNGTLRIKRKIKTNSLELLRENLSLKLTLDRIRLELSLSRFPEKEKLKREITGLKREKRLLKLTLKKLQVENDLFYRYQKVTASNLDFSKLSEDAKKEIILYIESNRKVLGLEETLKIIRLNPKNYYKWRRRSAAKCSHSVNKDCFKRQNGVLTKEEELKIIQLLQDPLYEHYPLTSLMWKAHYENIVHAGHTVWRKIQKEYKIVRKKPKNKKWIKGKALKANYPNQYLHADITQFKTTLGRRYYIYIVKDNYSKLIKSCIISDEVSAITRIKTFEEALADVDPKSEIKISFITDQGVENKNTKVKQFFLKYKTIDLKFARIDIPFSNTMIERYNMDLKYMYLYKEHINSLTDLKQCVDRAIKEHNQIKRMACLNGQTPYEVYHGIPSRNEQIKMQWAEAIKNRSTIKKRLNCCI